MKEVWFIRHAESESNAGKITANTQDNPLTERGQKQAENLTAYLYFADRPDLIICSKYKRAIQTMQYLSECFPKVPVEEWPVHEFTYLDQEKYANTTEEERKPAKSAYWNKCDPQYKDGTNSESFLDLTDRATYTINSLLYRKENLIYVYSHGWFIKMIWWMLINHNLKNNVTYVSSTDMKNAYSFFESIQLPNTGILKVKMHDKDDIWLSSWTLAYA